MKEDLKLFTPIEKGLPSTSQWVLTIIFVSNIMEVKHLFYDIEKGFTKKYKVGYWLDLSKLTTIEKAKNLACDAYYEGRYYNSKKDRNNAIGIDDFITQNINKL